MLGHGMDIHSKTFAFKANMQSGQTNLIDHLIDHVYIKKKKAACRIGNRSYFFVN